MSKSLYELKDDYKQLEFLLEDGVFDQEAISEAMKSVEEQLAKKAEGYIMVSRNIEAKEVAIKSEIIRLKARMDSMKKGREAMLGRLKEAMETTDKKVLSSALFTMSLRKRPKSVTVLDQSLVPKAYIKTSLPIESVDKKAVADAIKAGVEIDGVEYKSLGNNLKIS